MSLAITQMIISSTAIRIGECFKSLNRSHGLGHVPKRGVTLTPRFLSLLHSLNH